MKVDKKILYPNLFPLSKEDAKALCLNESSIQAEFIRSSNNPFVRIECANIGTSTGFFLQEYRDSYIIVTCAHCLLDDNGEIAKSIIVRHRHERRLSLMGRIAKRLRLFPFPEIVDCELVVKKWCVSDNKKEDIAFIQVEKSKDLSIKLFNRPGMIHYPHFAFVTKSEVQSAILYVGSFDRDHIAYTHGLVPKSFSEIYPRNEHFLGFKLLSQGKMPYHMCKIHVEPGSSGSPVWGPDHVVYGVNCKCVSENSNLEKAMNYYLPFERIENAFDRVCKYFH